MAKKNKIPLDMLSYMMLVSAMITVMLYDLEIAMFVGFAWVGLLMFWHIRNDATGSKTYARYLGKAVVGA